MRAFALNADIDACGSNPDTLQAKQTNALQNSVHFSHCSHLRCIILHVAVGPLVYWADNASASAVNVRVMLERCRTQVENMVKLSDQSLGSFLSALSA